MIYHEDCQNSCCEICYLIHYNLETMLRNKLKLFKRYLFNMKYFVAIDDYKEYLKTLNIPYKNKAGWLSKEGFDDVTIKKYINFLYN